MKDRYFSLEKMETRDKYSKALKGKKEKLSTSIPSYIHETCQNIREINRV